MAFRPWSSFTIIERSPRHKEYEKLFDNYKETFDQIKRDKGLSVWIYKIEEKEAAYSKVLCVSEGKKAKETAIKDQRELRAEKDLKGLQLSIHKGHIKDLEKVNKKIGRLEERYPGLAKKFQIELKKTEDTKKVLALTYKKK